MGTATINFMDQLELKIESLERKIDALQSSINKLKRMFLLIVIVSIALFVLPLMGLVFVIPQFLSVYSGGLQ